MHNVILLEPGVYQTSVDRGNNCTKVSLCNPGESHLYPESYHGTVSFQDGNGQEWRASNVNKITFKCDENSIITSVFERNPNGDTYTQDSLVPTSSTGSFKTSPARHLWQKVEDKFRRSFQNTSTSPVAANNDSQKTQGPIPSSHSNELTSEAGSLTGEYVEGQDDEGQGDEHIKYTQATTGQRGGVDDGSRSDCKSGA
jgi:hypothetical protein